MTAIGQRRLWDEEEFVPRSKAERLVKKYPEILNLVGDSPKPYRSFREFLADVENGTIKKIQEEG